MTLEELIEFKQKLQLNKDSLEQKDLSVEIICDAIEVLEELNANQALINLWYSSSKDEIVNILKELE